MQRRAPQPRPAPPPILRKARVDTYHQVKHELRALIEDLAARGEPRLPAEDQLSDWLGVSRPTVRSALLSLQKEGRIQRLHGRGTFINRHALKVAANLAEDRPFVELLAQLGHDAAVRNLSIHTGEMPAEVAAALEVDPGEPACVIERRFEASGRPAVATFDYVPVQLVVKPVDEVTGEASLFAFVERYTGRRVRYSVAEILPLACDPKVAAALELHPADPVLLLAHTHVDDDDRPVAFTHAYVNHRYIPFSIVRTYTDA